jgi:hypothetical protein
MADKLIDAAQVCWRAVDAAHLVASSVAARCSTRANYSSGPSTLRPQKPTRINRDGGRMKHPNPQVITVSQGLGQCRRSLGSRVGFRAPYRPEDHPQGDEQDQRYGLGK